VKTKRRTVVVKPPGGLYRVHFERDGIDRVGRELRQLTTGRRAVVVSDANVAALYAGRVLRSLSRARIQSALITIPPGERFKTLATVSRIYDHLLESGADRDTVVIALGGGVVGDVAGFSAATFLRGLPVIQMPTTVLAQADSSVGGKTGVDLPSGKNLVGAFHQPALVLADIKTPATLPERHVRAGFAEVVKVGMALDASLFRLLERHAEELLELDADLYSRAIAAAVRVKADVVARDERDRGPRMLLNYGHTIGHALEAAGRYRRWLHGEAVALGMAAAARLAVAVGWLPRQDLDRQEALLERFGLPLRLRRVSAEAVMAHMGLDKKARGGRPAFVLTRGVGVASVHRTLSRNQVVNALRQLGAEP
jgi:3-dehydroquinate synthase